MRSRPATVVIDRAGLTPVTRRKDRGTRHPIGSLGDELPSSPSQDLCAESRDSPEDLIGRCWIE